MSVTFNNQIIQLDIVNWVSREFYEPHSSVVKTISRRLRKKHKLKIDQTLLTVKVKRYREIYGIAKKSLPKYIISSESGYANPQDIKHKEFKQFLSKKLPGEDNKILDTIIDWVVYYEYLR